MARRWQRNNKALAGSVRHNDWLMACSACSGAANQPCWASHVSRAVGGKNGREGNMPGIVPAHHLIRKMQFSAKSTRSV
jgi:hypothetical protein